MVAHEISTRHSPSAWPWLCQPVAPEAGVVIGIDNLSGGVWRYDPWELYGPRVITSPSMLILGQLGKGKSALAKTYLYRQCSTGTRQIFVLDPKGEYELLAKQLGLAHLRLRPGGTLRMNPLDSGPLAGTNRFHAQVAMIEALAGVSLSRRLQPAEQAAIAVVVRSLDAGATLADVVEALASPTASTAAKIRMTVPDATVALRDVGLGLAGLVEGALAGMLDGPSTIEVDWSGPGVVLDLSAVFNTAAIGPVMVCAGAWLSQVMAMPGPRRIMVVDEAWAVLGRPEVAAWLQQVAKLARTYGVQLMVITHRLSDLTAQAAAGTAAAAQALGLIADMETHVVHGQPDSERDLAISLLGLSESEADLVCQIGPHRALWRVGGRVGVVDHVLGPDETDLVWTDAAMAVQ